MTSIKADLVQRLQTVLLNCNEFESDRALAAIFVDERIHPWVKQVPQQTANVQARVQAVIAWLSKQTRHDTAENGLVLLLRVLSDQKEPGDKLHHELRELAEELATAESSELLYLALNPNVPRQLPARAQHFVNRERELAKLRADLQPGQVIALCGPGGMGKSALAVEAIQPLEFDRCPDGLIWHSFYGQPQAAIALEAIARALGEEPKPTPQAAAQRALAHKRLLLVLDGTEEADNLGEVLRACSSANIVIITSRKRSDARAQRQDLEPLPPRESIKLLQAWGGGRAADSAAVQQICDQVDGLPLAVRLVGHYLAATEMDAADYLTWLQTTPIIALSQGDHREESVAILLEKSLSQVSAPAQSLLGVIGLLALQPFSSEPLAAALAMSPLELRPLLAQLVNYGLLLRPDSHYEVSHALIHTYAREKLPPPPEVIARLADYYTQLATTESAKGLPGYHRLDGERAHLLQVLAGCHKQGAWEAVQNLAKAVDNYLQMQGHWTERVMVLTIRLKSAQRLGDRQNEVASLGNLGNTYSALGKVKQAIEFYQQAMVISREIGDRRGEGNHMGNLGLAYSDLGQVNKAIEFYQQAMVISREIGDRRGEGAHVGNLGNTYSDLGQVDKAIEFYQQALGIAREIGDRRGEGNDLGNLGVAYSDLGEVTKAIEFYQQALVISREIGDKRGEGVHVSNLGIAYRKLGQANKAIEFYQQALGIAREIGDRRGEGARLGNLGNTYSDLGQVNKAIEFYQQALGIAREMGNRQMEGSIVGNLGAAYSDLGEVAKAIEFYQQALVISREIGDKRGEGADLGNLGVAYRKLGQANKAIEFYQQALGIAHEIGDSQNEGTWLGNLGLAYADLGQVAKAIEFYQQALLITQEIGSRFGEAIQLHNLGNLYKEQSQVALAHQYLQQSLAIFEEIKSPNAEVSRRLLAELENSTAD